MAGIDKIYGNHKNYLEFLEWSKRKRVSEEFKKIFNYSLDKYLKHYHKDMGDTSFFSDTKEFPIANFSRKVDEWLIAQIDELPKFVSERLKEQYVLK